jgi:hypothetical protein
MRNFVIVGTQRTGSSAIGEIIGLHPQITCGWEWTVRVPSHRKLRVANAALEGEFSVLLPRHREHMERMHRADKTWLGFRCLFRSPAMWMVHPRFSPALWIDRLEAYLRWFGKRPDTHVIHIVRGDNVEWLKSKEMSRVNNSYWGREYDPNARVKINLREAVKRSISKNWVDQRLGTLAETNPYLRISYETFVSDADREMARMFDFLKCDGTKARLEERKAKRQSSKQTFEYVSNYGEVVSELERRGLRYSIAAEG